MPFLLGGLVLAVLAVLGVNRRMGAPRHRGPVTDHFDGERFHNLEPFPDKGLLQLLRWQLRRERGEWYEWDDAPPGPAPVRSVTGGGLRVTWVNHATVLVQMDGVNILTDPVWSDRVGPFPWAGAKRRRSPGLRFEELPPIHVVLLSHNHYDHLDVPTLRRLAATHRPLVVAPLGNGALLEREGIPGWKELDWGESLDVAPGVRVRAEPARHWSARSNADRFNSLWASYVIAGPAGRWYYGGDTGFGGHLTRTGASFGPFRLAVLPIGAFKPEWFMKSSHMGPAEAIEAARLLRAAVSVPIHYGTFPLADDGATEAEEQLRAELARGAAAPPWRPLEHGIAFDVPPLADERG